MNRKPNSPSGLRIFYLGLIAALLLSLAPGAAVLAQETDPDGGTTRTFLPAVVTGNRNDTVSQLSEEALDLVAEQHGLPRADLQIVHATETDFPLTGIHAYHFKIADASGEMYAVALNAEGAAYDGEELVAAEEAAYQADYGRLSPELVEALAAPDAPQSVDVIIWLQMPEFTPLDRPQPEMPGAQGRDEQMQQAASADTQADASIALAGVATDSLDGSAPVEADIADGAPAQTEPDDAQSVEAQQALDAYFAAVDARLADAVTATTQPVVDRLDRMGIAAESATHAPAVYTSLTAETARTVNQWPGVDRIYLDGRAQPTMSIARQVVGATTVNSRGYSGSGVRVAEIEVGGRIATGNPYLSGVVQDLTYSCANQHATWVAGVIRSTHPTVRGIAPGVSLWVGGSCSGTYSQLQNRSTAAVTWGARVQNHSWGADTNRVLGANDRFYDNIVTNQYRTVVVSAGNMGGAGCPQGTDGDVGTPGLAFNVITVGNFDDKNTVSISGDTMNPCSSWRDPISTNGDREKPEVAAPGTAINTTSTASPWVNASVNGTSFSSPIVAAGAALLMQRSSSLTAWPEAVKAILMASALQNIEGSARLSERDGAGGVNLWRADDIARGYGGRWGGQSYTCSTASSLNVATMALVGGRRFRGVIAWDTNPNYSSYTSRPSADLDLQIVNANGTVVATSASYDNTYEIVDFTPSSTGTYRLRVNRFRCSYNPQWLGWAWYQP